MLDGQLCLTLCDPMDCSLPGCCVDRILQARILEWVAILPTQGLNPGLPHCRQILYHLSHLCGDGYGGNAIQTRTRLLILKGSWGLWDGAAYTDMFIWWEFFEWHLWFVYFFKRYQFSSVAQSCLTLCDPVDCSMPGFPVHHQLLELVQTHVQRVRDAIQLSHPLLSPSPPAFNLSQHEGLFQWVSFLHQVAKVLELQLQHQSPPLLTRKFMPSPDFLFYTLAPASPKNLTALG